MSITTVQRYRVVISLIEIYVTCKVIDTLTVENEFLLLTKCKNASKYLTAY